jgi:hypothetical protein
MIGVLVTFDYDDGFDHARIARVAEGAQRTFQGMPGLRLKAFTIDHEHRRATNVYLWESEETARAFFDDALRERVTGLYGVAPRIEFVEIAALVDNA